MTKYIFGLIGLVYYYVLMGVGMLFGGVGHGTFLFIYIPNSPFVTSQKWALIPASIFWFTLWIFLYSHSKKKKLFIIIFMLVVHYAGIAYIILELLKRDDTHYLINAWQQVPFLVLLWITIYLSGQIYIYIKTIGSYLKYDES